MYILENRKKNGGGGSYIIDTGSYTTVDKEDMYIEPIVPKLKIFDFDEFLLSIRRL
jgi:hypothetical protein